MPGGGVNGNVVAGHVGVDGIFVGGNISADAASGFCFCFWLEIVFDRRLTEIWLGIMDITR